jgi:hypothetical protein
MPAEGTLVIVFYAAPSRSSAWPESVVAYSDQSLEETRAAAKETLAKNLTWADRFEISDHEGRLLCSWPEKTQS